MLICCSHIFVMFQCNNRDDYFQWFANDNHTNTRQSYRNPIVIDGVAVASLKRHTLSVVSV